ncbi:hypothetical protein B6N60_04632 [Richelia sinica FACHB-800]|uniref:DUF4114 domain-containing protein n=1 Tax=Richelia sinica FACHB-800 TaxID=1357546 RepID=A0A975TBS8_9NOST|nr:hypothetical protein B6N60_04632 [Richelia sinica FACHB-800]
MQKLSLATAGAAVMALGTAATAEAGVLGGKLFASGGDVTVTILPSTAGFTNILELVSPTGIVIGNNKDDVGKTFNLGPFADGQELIFGINVTNTGDFFKNGPGSRNADGLAHNLNTDEGNGSILVGFEDLFGGGDQDYDDVVYRFTGLKAVVPEPTSALGVVGFAALVAISQRKKLQKAFK